MVMSSGEEIDYNLFKGQFIPETKDISEELIKKREQRNKEDELAAIRYKARKDSLKHKYSPLRHSLSKEEKDKFIEKTTKKLN